MIDVHEVLAGAARHGDFYNRSVGSISALVASCELTRPNPSTSTCMLSPCYLSPTAGQAHSTAVDPLTVPKTDAYQYRLQVDPSQQLPISQHLDTAPISCLHHHGLPTPPRPSHRHIAIPQNNQTPVSLSQNHAKVASKMMLGSPPPISPTGLRS